tara:strand:- start:47 stop:199 length:153 start_codon:yes stop_codon:yes gene_type:complete
VIDDSGALWNLLSFAYKVKKSREGKFVHVEMVMIEREGQPFLIRFKEPGT